MKGYGPADPLQSPRFAGISTFLRLPHTLHLDGVDVAFVGLPFDTGVTFRAGARFGPKAIREGSLALRPDYNPAQRVAVFERVSAIDYGDAPVVPGFTDRSYDKMAEALSVVHGAGAVPIGFGGDHSVLLAELRAAAAVHGPLALVQFDSHSGTWDEYFGEKYTHGTVVRRALEEGLIDPARSTLMGMRGGLYGPGDLDDTREMGFTLLPWDDLAQLGTGAAAAAVDRAGGKAFLTFDIDFVDPAYAPGTGTPECGGPTLDAGAGAAARLPRPRHRRRRRGRGAARPRQLAPHGDAGGHRGVGDPQPHRGGAAGGRRVKLRAACVQLNTRQDTAATVRTAGELVRRAAAEGARLVALPETWAYKGRHAGIAGQRRGAGRAEQHRPGGAGGRPRRLRPGRLHLRAFAGRRPRVQHIGSVRPGRGAAGRVSQGPPVRRDRRDRRLPGVGRRGGRAPTS